ncbi:MAG: cytochrome P450, partial [Ktedonobacteraceae bacterium]
MLHTLSTLDDVQRMYDWFEKMRNTQPVWLDESSGCWHVFRYDDVLNIISDYTLFSSERLRQRFPRRATENAEGGQPRAGRSIIAMDPPQHRQYRNLV